MMFKAKTWTDYEPAPDKVALVAARLRGEGCKNCVNRGVDTEMCYVRYRIPVETGMILSPNPYGWCSKWREVEGKPTNI